MLCSMLLGLKFIAYKPAKSSKSGNATRRLSISPKFADQLLESIDMLSGKIFDYFLTTNKFLWSVSKMVIKMLGVCIKNHLEYL